jgi:hypothetical protein
MITVKFKTIIDQYEAMEPVHSPRGSEDTISASFTPNNGIRLTIFNAEEDQADESRAEIDLEPEVALSLGEALIRWAKAGH